MVPVRVLLESFLTYDEAVFDFRGARLWSIWGDNGAGKSAIFDAITYCLYGVHRGGAAQGADAELLRKGQTRMSACFEFELDGTLYRVTRTLSRRRKRAGGSADERAQQADWFDPEDGVWRAVAGTEARGGLADWVREKVGLGYETFVSSVVLLQGQSERLLQARPDQRFTILGDLIELQEYERLAGLARDAAREARATVVQLEAALAGTAPVGEEELAALESRFAAADGELTAHRTRVAEAIRLVEGARAYRKQAAQAELRRGELREMRQLIAGGDEIRRAAREHADVSAAAVPVEEALAALASAAAAAEEAAAHRAAAAAVDVAAAETAAREAEAQADMAVRAANEAMAEPGRLRSEREALAPLVAAARRITELETALSDGDERLALLDAELGELPGVSASLEAIEALGRARPLVAQLVRERSELADMLGRLDGHEPATALARARNGLEAASAAAEEAQRDREQALGRRHERQAAVAVLQRTFEERLAARSEGTCSHCGQRVEHEHIDAELRRAAERLATGEEVLATADRELAAADRVLAAAGAAVEQRRAAVRDLEAIAGRVADRWGRVEEMAGQLSAMEDLPAWAAAVADAPAEQLPALAARVAAEAARGEAIRRERDRLQALGYRRESLAADLEARRAELATLSAASSPATRAAAVARERELVTAIAAAEERTRAATEWWEARRREVDDRRRALDAARTRSAELETAAARREAEAVRLRGEAELRLEPVPAAWRERALRRDPALARELSERLAALAGAPERGEALDRAEREIRSRQVLLRELEETLERTPPAHRVPVEEAERIQRELEAETPARQEARDEALRAREQARRLREERRDLECRVQDASRDRRRWERLARLLGRGGLQARLMDEALAGIQQYANETLRQISGGQLEVRLTWNERGERQEIGIQAVDLGSSEEPMDVAFISGGQKFRAAVALAAGIGRYAGGTLRSLVIDEGFGSLDQMGRQQIIDQLRQIATVMDRVIVVSHQEDFQDRRLFPAGYVLRREGRRTIVSRSI
ncbi:MAG TPA: SMC family ATPase [Candidatus Dormibacteraeota bacterium]